MTIWSYPPVIIIKSFLFCIISIDLIALKCIVLILLIIFKLLFIILNSLITKVQSSPQVNIKNVSLSDSDELVLISLIPASCNFT